MPKLEISSSVASEIVVLGEQNFSKKSSTDVEAVFFVLKKMNFLEWLKSNWNQKLLKV